MRMLDARSLFIFDWDNTLVDSHEKGIECCLRAVRTVGVDINPDLFRQRFTPDYHAVYRGLGIAEQHFKQIDDAWLCFYAGEVQTQLFADARPVLDELGARGHLLAIATTGQRSRIHSELKQLCLEERFSRVVCREDVRRVKPEPDAVLSIKQSFPEAESFVLVGDHPDDIEMARRAGVEALLIARGGPVRAQGQIASLYELIDPAQA